MQSKTKHSFRSLARWIVRLIIHWAATLAKLVSWSTAGNSNKLLLVRTDAIGDFVLFSPALQPIREHYRGYQITLILQSRVFPLAESCPYVDRIIPFEVRKYKRNLLYRLKFLFALSRDHFSTAINTMYSRDVIGDEMVHWSGARQSIGWDSTQANMSASEKISGDKYYDVLLEGNFQQNAHELDRNRKLLELLDIQTSDFAPRLTTRASAPIERFWDEREQSGRPLIGLVPGALSPSRIWPIERYGELIQEFREVWPGVTFLVVGSSEDSLFPNSGSDIINLTGKTGLGDLPVIFSKCDLVIGTESGPMHIAMTTTTPTVCILGGGHFGRFMPYGDEMRNRFVFKEMDCYGCNWKCIFDSSRCITEISITQVWDVSKSLLAGVQDRISPGRLDRPGIDSNIGRA